MAETITIKRRKKVQRYPRHHNDRLSAGAAGRFIQMAVRDKFRSLYWSGEQAGAGSALGAHLPKFEKWPGDNGIFNKRGTKNGVPCT